MRPTDEMVRRETATTHPSTHAHPHSGVRSITIEFRREGGRRGSWTKCVQGQRLPTNEDYGGIGALVFALLCLCGDAAARALAAADAAKSQSRERQLHIFLSHLAAGSLLFAAGQKRTKISLPFYDFFAL